MATPYVTPDIIANAPTGIPWNVIPFPKATSAQQLAEQYNICWRATGRVDGFCNQPLRATLDTEQVQGPDYRLTVDQNGVGRALLSRIPILDVVGAQVSARATIPRSWSVIPAEAVTPESPPIGVYGSGGFGAAGDIGNAVLIAPGYISWAGGRNGYTVELAYLNGWPHAGLTAAASAGATQLSVDDVTAFAGAGAFIYDGVSTESVMISTVAADSPTTVPGGASVPVGPGTVSLAAALQHDHAAGIMVSGLPQIIQWATILYCAAQVLDSGATSVTIPNMPGSQSTGGNGIQSLIDEAERELQPFRRVI